MFPDGPSPELTVRATFTATPASFMSSVGVISGPAADEDLLRFATVYLRSNLVRYFLVMNAYQVLSERHRVSLRDVEGFPFFSPERHHDPQHAWQIVKEVANVTRNSRRCQLSSSPMLTTPLIGAIRRRIRLNLDWRHDARADLLVDRSRHYAVNGSPATSNRQCNPITGWALRPLAASALSA